MSDLDHKRVDPEGVDPEDDASNRFIETLLREAHRGDQADDERRIESLMNRIRQEDTIETTPARSSENAIGGAWKRSPLLRLVLAACVLVVIGLSFRSMGSQNAYATVMRAAKASSDVREYRVDMVNAWPVRGIREVTASLYIDPANRFCLQHPGLPTRGELWAGGDTETLWIVPEFGPVLTGAASDLSDRLTDQGLGPRLLHLETLLVRLADDYELESLPNESIRLPNESGLPASRLQIAMENVQPADYAVRETDSDRLVACERVRGRRKSASSQWPETVELWANASTGVAERVRLDWDPNRGEGIPIRWDIRLVGTPDLPEEWFSPLGHVGKGLDFSDTLED